MDPRKPPPPLLSESIDLTCADSEDEEKKGSSLPVVDLASVLDDVDGDVDGDDVKIQSKQGKRHIAQSNQRSISSLSRKKIATSSTRNAAKNLKTTGLFPEDILEVSNDSNNKHQHQPCYWSCPICTCSNTMDIYRCDACLYRRCCPKKPPPPQSPDLNISMPLSATATRKNDATADNGENDGSDDDDGYDSWEKGNWCFLLPNNDNKNAAPDLQTSKSNNNNATITTVEATNEGTKDDEQDNAKVKNHKKDKTRDNGENDDRDDDDDDDGYDGWRKGNWCFLLPNNDKDHPSTTTVTDTATTTTATSSNSNEVRMKVSTNNDDEDNKNPTSDLQNSRSNNNATTSITMEAIDKVMKGDEQDVKVKKEGTANGLTTEEREKRKSNFDIWKKANTDPDDGLGRYVFKRGCAKACITTILGGSGIWPWPKVKTPPTAFLQNPAMENPFIESGEFYVAGNEGWNPLGPRFPGDTGCVISCALKMNPQQEEFHLFVQCASKPHKRLWHGKNAQDGRLYVGVYKRQPDDGPYCDEVVHFNSDRLLHSNKMYLAKFFAERPGHADLPLVENSSGKEVPYYPDATKKKAAKAFADEIDEDGTTAGTGVAKFHLKSEFEKNTLYMYQWLIQINYYLDITPVVFVRYDEDLYRSLKESGAAMNRKDRTGRVSLEPDMLQQYY